MLLNCGVGEDSWDPLECKEIKPVNPKWNQSWIFFGQTDAKAEAPILWSPYAKSWLFRKYNWCWERLKAGGKEENRGWDDEWCHQLDGHEFEQAPGVGDGQESLACCSPLGRQESDTTEWLNNNNIIIMLREKRKWNI